MPNHANLGKFYLISLYFHKIYRDALDHPIDFIISFMVKPVRHTPMEKEISGLNTYWVMQYLGTHHPEINIPELLDKVTSQNPCYIENLITGNVEQVTFEHLMNDRYWYSNQFIQGLYTQIQQAIPDPKIGYKMGRTIYKTQPVLKSAICIPLLGLHRVAHRVSKEAAKFNRTKVYTVEKQEKGLVVIRATHFRGIVVNDFTMQWNAGCFASYATLAGATDIDIKVICIDPGPKTHGNPEVAVWDFEIRYKEPTLGYRFTKAILYNLPWVRELTERAEQIEEEHIEQIIHRDKIIQDHTDKLLRIQERLIQQEREIIENRLKDISLELITTEERERRAIAQDLHDSVTQLLAVSIMKVRSVRNSHSPEETLDEIETYLSQSLEELRSLTFQISPPVLYDFGLEAAINWLIDDVNKHHNMQLTFTNHLPEPLQPNQEYTILLYRTIRELVINIIKHGKTRKGLIALAEQNEKLVITVQDYGKGFELSYIKKGFGLFSLKERIENLKGIFEVETSPQNGTKITITISVSELDQCNNSIESFTA